MRHFLLLIAFVLGAGLIVLGLASGDAFGLVRAAVGLALIVGAIVNIRRTGQRMREDLLAGTDVVARWQLSGADLVAFHTIDRQRAEIGRDHRNWLNIPDHAPPEGVPVIIGREHWLIGSRLYAQGAAIFGLLARVATLDGDPGYIEIACLGQKNGPGYLLILLRLPVSAAARPSAAAATAWLADRVPPQNQEVLQRWFPDYA